VTFERVSALTLRGEIVRKLLHMTWGLIPLLYAAGMDRPTLLILLCVALAVALATETARRRVPVVGESFTRLLRPLLRLHEHQGWSGATWLLVSFLLVTLLFPRSVAIASMWAVAIGDAVAALVGRMVGGYRMPGSRKTIAGSAACAVATTIGAVLVAQLPIAESLVAGATASVAEWPDAPLDDNLRIGLLVGAGILLSHMAFS
jgi:dolichol kinase